MLGNPELLSWESEEGASRPLWLGRMTVLFPESLSQSLWLEPT